MLSRAYIFVADSNLAPATRISMWINRMRCIPQRASAKSVPRPRMTAASSGPKCTALLVVDLQLGMFNGERIAPIHAGEMLLTRVRDLLVQARRSGTPVIHVRHADPVGELLEHGTPNWQIHPSIAPHP